jgi:hypothetical protein
MVLSGAPAKEIMERMRESQPVVIARGSSEQALEQIAQMLQEAGIPFDVQEEVGEGPGRHDWRWAVRVRMGDVESARQALARDAEPSQTPQPPVGPQPAPGPLFDSGGREALRVLLMLGAFGLAAALFFRDCVT